MTLVRLALTRVSSLSGFDLRNSTRGQRDEHVISISIQILNHVVRFKFRNRISFNLLKF